MGGKRVSKRRGCATAALLLPAVLLLAFLVYFPGRQSALALTLATGLGVERLQARVDALEDKAIRGESFADADRRFLRDLYSCFAKGARATYVLRQSGQLMAHYLGASGESLRIAPRVFLGSSQVEANMELLRQRLAEDLRAGKAPAGEYTSGIFHMGAPKFFDAAVALYVGQVSLRPELLDGGRLILHWRADLPWQWPSYESLHDTYGDYHAQSFPLPNARSLLAGPEYMLWLDDGLGEYLVRLGVARPFLAWSQWEEETHANSVLPR